MSDDPLSPACKLAALSAAEALAWPSDPQVADCMRGWLEAATLPASHDTRLFAKLIAERDVHHERALLGLAQPAWRALLMRHFARTQVFASLPPMLHAEGHEAFVYSLHVLLLTHASPAVHADDAQCLATIIAHACLRPDHLWRDLGLAGRDEVTWMLTRYFPTLVVLNVANWRWKKFLAQQRALSLGLEPGPAPGCPGCEDYGHCFPA